MNEHQMRLFRLFIVAVSVDDGVDEQTRIMAKALLKSLPRV